MATDQRPAPIASNNGGNYIFWAIIGAFFVVIEAYTWISWITGPYFTPTLPPENAAPMTGYPLFMMWFLQIVAPIAMVVCIWFWIIKPWRAEGKLTTDGMIAICLTAIVFFDPTYNYVSTALHYNPFYINYGAWTTNTPGWMSPNAHLLPEPLLVSIPGYLVAIFGQAVLGLWIVRKYKARKPNASTLTMVFLIILTIFVTDTIAEIFLIRSQVYIYPAAIHALTLWPGEWYQFPLTEGFFFGGLGIGVAAMLMYFKDDKGETFADRGLEKTRYSVGKKQVLKFLALFGCTHGAFLMLYLVPSAFVALHSDPYPKNIPQHFFYGFCVYGKNADQCPGPGVMMPRPTQQFFDPNFENQK